MLPQNRREIRDNAIFFPFGLRLAPIQTQIGAHHDVASHSASITWESLAHLPTQVSAENLTTAPIGAFSRSELQFSLVVDYDYLLVCHCMTVLGHAVLCLASKMRRHCVSEDSDAVAHNPKI